MKMPSVIVDSKASGANWQSSWLQCRYSVKQDDKAIESSQFSNKILNDIKNSCNSSSKDVQKEALKCWELWIHNQDVDTWKQNKICYNAVQPLVTKKFQPHHKDTELCLIRLKLFWDLIGRVQTFISQFEGPQYVLETFIQSCITWLSSSKEINETVHYTIIKYLHRLFSEESKDGNNCEDSLSMPKMKLSLTKNLFNRLLGKFLNVFLAWDNLKDKKDMICLWTEILKLCEQYHESIPITLWHNIFRLVRRIISKPTEDFKIRITFLHRCATVLKSVLNSSKHLDANFMDTTPSEALMALLVDMCFLSEESCDFETFLICQEVCQAFISNIIRHRGYEACISTLIKIDDIPSKALLWGLWGGFMKSFKGSVKSSSVDLFDPQEMKFYRKLRGVAVNFSLDEKFLDEKCVSSIQTMVADVLHASNGFTTSHSYETAETENYEIIKANNLKNELLENDGVFGPIVVKSNLFFTSNSDCSNKILFRNKIIKKFESISNSYLKNYLDLIESINKNCYSLQVFVNFKDLILTAMLSREMFAISILKIEGFPPKKELKNISDVKINPTENKLFENDGKIAKSDDSNSLFEISESKESTKINETEVVCDEKKSATKRRRISEEIASPDFKRRRSNRISLKPKVACCGDASCTGNLKVGEKRKRNDPTDCCSKKAKISDAEKNKSKCMIEKSPTCKSFPKIETVSKKRRGRKKIDSLSPKAVEKEISENDQVGNQEVVKECDTTDNSKKKKSKKSSSRKENKKPKSKMITKSIKSYFSKINDDSIVVVDPLIENVENIEVRAVKDNEELVDSPNDSVVSSIDIIEQCLLENFEILESSPVESDLVKLDSNLDNISLAEIVETLNEPSPVAVEESILDGIVEQSSETKLNVNTVNFEPENLELNDLQSCEISSTIKAENEIDLGCEDMKPEEILEDKELVIVSKLLDEVIKPDPETSNNPDSLIQNDKTEENRQETPERKTDTELNKNETPKGNRNVPRSRAFRMLALIQDPFVSNNADYSEKVVSEQKFSCKKFPKAEKNSRASRMLALLPEHDSSPLQNEPEVKIIEPTKKPFNDQNVISRADINDAKVASLKKEPGASVLKSPNMATPPRKKSIRFDDDRNETMVYFTDSPPLKSLQRVGLSFRRNNETENLNKPS